MKFFTQEYELSRGVIFLPAIDVGKLLQMAERNPEIQVSYYVKYIYQTLDRQEVQRRMKHYDEMEDKVALFPSLIHPNSYLAWLVRDIRQFVLLPYVANFYLYLT